MGDVQPPGLALRGGKSTRQARGNRQKEGSVAADTSAVAVTRQDDFKCVPNKRITVYGVKRPWSNKMISVCVVKRDCSVRGQTG